jgi:hypothetical protein
VYSINKSLLTICAIFFLKGIVKAQDSTITAKDTTASHSTSNAAQKQLDLLDILQTLIYKHPPPRIDTSGIKTGKFHASALPSVQYTLQTGFAVSAIANGVFYTTNTANANASNVLMSVNYTQKKQFFVPIQANIWTKNNKYNILTDWHFEQFPQTTYGLGGYTTVSNGYTINYTYVRLYQTLLKTLGHDFYAGAGYDLDYFWNIRS